MATKSSRSPSTPSSSAASRARPKNGSRMTRRASSSASSSSGRPQDAIALLKADHREVKALFAEYDKAEEDTKKQDLADRICGALKVHTRVEEEFLYPAAYDALDQDGDDLLDEAEVEHACAKALIAEIEAMSVGEPLFDAKVKVLGEYIDHHVKEEEGELFPECKDADMDLKALGAAMAARKAELMGA